MASRSLPLSAEQLAAQIDRSVIQLFALVSDAIAGATLALLSGDRIAGRALAVRDERIDALFHELEQRALRAITEGVDSPQGLRYLVAVLRLLPELERSGDLAEHVASRAGRGLDVEMSARLRGLVEQMGEVASTMWRIAADAYADRAPDVAPRLDRLDDEMDDLHDTFLEELAGGATPVRAVIELALIGRFYERLGDHAVNLARQVPGRVLRATIVQ